MSPYPVLITETATGFTVAFIDFPDCAVAAERLDDALGQAAEALEQRVDALLATEDGALPEPTSLPAALERARESGAATHLVALAAGKGRAIRVNITIDEHLLAAIDDAAARLGTNRSAYLAAAARQALAADPEGGRMRGLRRGRRGGRGHRHGCGHRGDHDRREYRTRWSDRPGDRPRHPAG